MIVPDGITLPCRTSDPELFFSTDVGGLMAAKALCAGCPMAAACREEGRQLRATGVWGGEDDKGRTTAGRKPVRVRVPPQCGTEAGAKKHYRNGETPCEPCLAAQRNAKTERNARKLAECGTRPGYQRHRRLGEEACQPCRNANSDADRRLRNTGTTLAA